MAPAHLDVRRAMMAARKRLADLAKVAERGGIEARPAVAAVLQGARFRAVPVSVRGERRWQLTAEIGDGYVTPNDGAQGRDVACLNVPMSRMRTAMRLMDWRARLVSARTCSWPLRDSNPDALASRGF